MGSFMTWLALRALLARVPLIAWLIALITAAIIGAFAAIYHHGQSVGEERVHQIALVDSADKAHTLVKLAEAETDRRRGAAVVATRRADEGRVKRQALRDEVAPLLASLPAPVIALIHADDRQIARDSVALIVHAAVDSAWLVERDARIAADTVESHQIGHAEPPSHRGRFVAAGIVIAGTLAYLVAR